MRRALRSIGNGDEVTMRGYLVAAALVAAILGPAPASWAADAAPAPAQAESYRLGPGDKLKITTFGEASLSGDFQVDGSGMVPIPLIGPQHAAGKTVSEFQAAVEAALRDGYLKDPKVTVAVATYRPYYLMGEVMRPGEYAYSEGLTVLNAVASAGGFSYRANKKKVAIKHKGEDREVSHELSTTTPVLPGDTIRITERLF